MARSIPLGINNAVPVNHWRLLPNTLATNPIKIERQTM